MGGSEGRMSNLRALGKTAVENGVPAASRIASCDGVAITGFMRAWIGALVLAWWLSGAESTALAQGKDAGEARPAAGAGSAPSDGPVEAPLPPLAPPPPYDAPLPEPFPPPTRHRPRWGA